MLNTKSLDGLHVDCIICSVCGFGLMSKPNTFSSAFVTWALNKQNWHCDLIPGEGYKEFCPDCWTTRLQRIADAEDLF